MDVTPLRDAYAALFAEASASGFADPAAGEWGAEQVVAHIAANDEALARATEAVLAGRPPEVFDNHGAIDLVRIDELISQRGHLAALIEYARGTAERVCTLAEQLDDRGGDTSVRTRIQDGDDEAIDRDLPWVRVLEIQARTHLPRHLEQLRSLRPH